ncbi:E3 ubiquitin-protein ligase TRIM58-like [Entelurus aequoreus]|uniref:E3 ubiquitin-protein ligase TRIM58-like n=1 Tax=Entelurus aequoreus TaxID=161455 RepID=UPI002B1E43EC|nr:E3 ubiquitin-protein ligase TRIM58-like [Entelurus aequoreus]
MMAIGGVVLDKDQFNCSVCLDVLKEPVTIPCGHSYCSDCIRSCWDQQILRVFKCPQCRQTFKPRPELGLNTLLADMVEGFKKSGVQEALVGQSLAKRKHRAISQGMRQVLNKLDPDEQEYLQDELDSKAKKTRVYRVAFLTAEKKELEEQKKQMEKTLVKDQKDLEKTKNKARDMVENAREMVENAREKEDEDKVTVEKARKMLQKREKKAIETTDLSQAKVDGDRKELDKIMKKLKDNGQEYEKLMQEHHEGVHEGVGNVAPRCSDELGEGEAPRGEAPRAEALSCEGPTEEAVSYEGPRDEDEPVLAKKAKNMT